MNRIVQLDEANLGLFTDLYEMTMLQAYWAEGMNERAVFSLYFRELPAQRNFMLACGQGEVLAWLETVHFTGEWLDQLARIGPFKDEFLRYLESFRFSGDVYAMPEGTPVFPDEPIIEIEAPIGEAQLLESFVMNQIHVQTILASAAVRFRLAAGDRANIVDFGLRRMHGADAAMKGTRAYWIAGIAATSNVLGGIHYDVPVSGTMAHSYIQAHDDEKAAFEAFANLYPGTVLLVDTYDTIKGVERAIDLARDQGVEFSAIRLDSGDLLDLSLKARKLLDDAGLEQVQIFASGGLDEYKVRDLLNEGAPITGFGVGTRLGAAPAAPALDLAYKLTEYAGTPRTKASPGKAIYPGKKQVWRINAGRADMRDVVTGRHESRNGTPLLKQVMRSGEIIDANFADHHKARDYSASAVADLPPRLLKLDQTDSPYPIEISDTLKAALESVPTG